MVDPLSYFLLQPMLHDCVIPSVDDAYKRTLAANWKE